MPIDFSKLNDPQWQAQARAEREAEEAKQAEHNEKINRAIELLTELEVYEQLSEREQSFIRSCRTRVSTWLTLSDAQEKWLFDLHRRHQAQAAEPEPVKAPVFRFRSR